MWLGLAVHDTAQVMGAGLTYTQAYDDERAFKSATVTKLMRNMALAFAVPALAAYHLAKGSQIKGSMGMTSKAIPFFLKAFVGMAVLRTCGDAYHATLADESRGERWRHAMSALGDTFGAKMCLGTALSAVGLSTSVASVVGVGPAPFVVGAAGAAIVGGTGLVCALTLSEVFRLSGWSREEDEDGKGEGG